MLRRSFFESLILIFTYDLICIYWKYWYGRCRGWYLIRKSQNLIPKLPLLQIQIFFQIFLLIEILFLKQKLQNGLCSWASRAKMRNHNKKYYTYPESLCYALFKTAKKVQIFKHLSFWTYWTKISQKNYSEQSKHGNNNIERWRDTFDGPGGRFSAAT